MITEDIGAAVAGVDFVYTDVWVMGWTLPIHHQRQKR